MQKRNTKRRRENILSAVESEGEISVDALAERLSTSEVTIRKDLAALQDAGFLMRRFGGAIRLPSEQSDSSQSSLTPQKKAIALEASMLIRDHYRIVIDSGTTTRAMIPHLSAYVGLVVMTNSIQVANELRNIENEPTILMTGGTWDKRSESFQGRMAEAMLREYNFDQLFIGADGIDPDLGTTTYNEFVTLSQAMAEVSREVIVLAESSKLQRKIPNIELEWSQVRHFVSDSTLSELDSKLINKHGVTVTRARHQLGEY